MNDPLPIDSARHSPPEITAERNDPATFGWLRRIPLEAMIGLLLVALTAWVYLPVAHCGYLSYDDPDYVTGNRYVQAGLSWEGLRWAFTTFDAANWHPLTWLSLMLDVQLFGLNPAASHWINVALHAANALLLFVLLQRLTGAMWRSAVVAAIFALHPLRVESVAWIAERKDVLSAFFFLGSLLAWNGYLRAVRRHANFAVALLFFALGLLAKPMVVTLPCVLLLLDVWPYGRWTGTQPFGATLRLIREKTPFFVLSTAACIATYVAQHQAGVVRALTDLSLSARLENAVVSFARYLAKTLAPVDLAVFYPHPIHWPIAAVLLSAATVVCVTGAALAYAKTKPYFLVGWLWFLGMLVPTVGLVQVSEQAMADRYSYLPSIGLLVAAVWLIDAALRKLRVSIGIVTAVAIVAMGACVVGTRLQLRYWSNGETLFRRALEVTTDNFAAHYHLGVALLETGKATEAAAQFEATIRLRPDYANAHSNLGSALLREGRVEEAKAEFRRAFEIDPRHVVARCNLGLTLQQQGQLDEAAREFRAAAALGSKGAMGRYLLGNLALAQGNMTEAAEHFEAAVNAQPDHAEAHNNLGAALLRLGRAKEALRHFARALELQPKNAAANTNLADVLLQRGLVDAAADRYRRALEVQPHDADAHCGLGTALLLQGKITEAKREFTETLAVQPDSALAHNNLARVLLQDGDAAGAVAHLRSALEADPNNARTLTSLAWVQSTSDDPTVRNGRVAVELAQRADRLVGGSEPMVLRALAAANAESGHFAEATEIAGRALRLAGLQSNETLANALKTQLARYMAGEPFRETLNSAAREESRR